ncbi:MAG: LytTR family DNA-binding domain-containing protein [Bacteroidota bacterium]
MPSIKLTPKGIRQELTHTFPIVFNSSKVLAFFGLFTFLFLFLFEPFGFGNINLSQKAIGTLAHGLLTVLVLGINVYFIPRLFPAFFSASTWTRLKHIGWFFWNVLTAGSANYMLSQIMYGSNSFFSPAWIQFLGYSALFASIPVSILLLLTQIKVLGAKTHVQALQGIQEPQRKQQEDYIQLSSLKQNQSFCLYPSQLLYIESNKNYLSVYLMDEGEVKSLRFRNTLKNIREQLAEIDTIEKVHRAFLVNVDQVEEILREGHGYKLRFKTWDKEIPISRSYVQKIKNRLKATDPLVIYPTT